IEVPGKGPTVVGDVVDGLRYVRAWPGLFMTLLMATLINLLFTPAATLQPLLVTEHFGGGALELGWMNSGWGIGLVVGGLVLSAWGGFRRRILTMLVALIFEGAAFALISAVPGGGFPVALALITLAGFANPMVNGPMEAVLQANVAPQMQGRIFTLVASICHIAQPLGLAVVGPLADVLGVRIWYAVGGLSCIAMGLVGFASPAVLNLESGRQSSSVSAESPTGTAA
ncbi:MAG: MFS transporter, partial [Anaerolineae bacterium]|nr:MFS transporter [Anaerolineae bacterium]